MDILKSTRIGLLENVQEGKFIPLVSQEILTYILVKYYREVILIYKLLEANL